MPRRLALLVVTALLLPSSLAAATPTDSPSADSTVVLRAAHLFDGTSDRLVSPGVVVVTGGKIVAAGAEAAAPAGARTIDLGDATLLPGLIDAHVHLTGEASDNWYRDFVDGCLHCRRSGRCERPATPAEPSRPASPPCATSAPTTTSTSACATPSRPG